MDGVGERHLAILPVVTVPTTTCLWTPRPSLLCPAGGELAVVVGAFEARMVVS
ncbi:MAG: hypothetical protein IPN17_26615 [Deltaproteobacteria bacterium]|nr:hypothetical protein [Deltaproteobacteria bacterium]